MRPSAYSKDELPYRTVSRDGSPIHTNRRTDLNDTEFFEAIEMDTQFATLRGLSIYFSGIFRLSRHERFRLCARLGCTVAEQFTKSGVDLLVIGHEYGDRKIPKAQAWGIPVVREPVFFSHPEVLRLTS